MMPYGSVCVRSGHPDDTPPAPARFQPGQHGTRARDLMRSGCLTVKICMTPRRPVMQPSPSDAS
jgi:hypothetical protein